MDLYITVHESSGRWFVVRTTDWQIFAQCVGDTEANHVAAALNAYDAEGA
jgi:hypothetical protein